MKEGKDLAIYCEYNIPEIGKESSRKCDALASKQDENGFVFCEEHAPEDAKPIFVIVGELIEADIPDENGNIFTKESLERSIKDDKEK